MSLSGTLGTMSLGDLLQWVVTARKSGVVTVTQGKARLQLLVGGARILGVHSNEPPLLLGQFLLSRGKIDEKTIHDALARQDSTKENLGTVLIEMGAITSDELERYVVMKAEETIFGMLDWSEAMFEFDVNSEPDSHMVAMDHGIDDLIMRGAQRRDELVKMRTVLGNPGDVLCRTSQELPEAVRHSPMAARVFDAIDGNRTMKDILLHSRASEYFATKFLYELYRAGVVSIKESQEPETKPGSARSILEVATTLLNADQFDGAVSLLTASSHVFPEDTSLKQMLAKVEAGFLKNTYEKRFSPDCVPKLAVTAESAASRDDLGPNERFIIDLVADKENWSVKAMTRIAPLHEVDVVRATLTLMNKGLVEISHCDAWKAGPQVASLSQELLDLSNDSNDNLTAAVGVAVDGEDRAGGSTG